MQLCSSKNQKRESSSDRVRAKMHNFNVNLHPQAKSGVVPQRAFCNLTDRVLGFPTLPQKQKIHFAYSRPCHHCMGACSYTKQLLPIELHVRHGGEQI